jgi:hypothetical protein
MVVSIVVMSHFSPCRFAGITAASFVICGWLVLCFGWFWIDLVCRIDEVLGLCALCIDMVCFVREVKGGQAHRRRC